jgi:competence protein ComEC
MAQVRRGCAPFVFVIFIVASAVGGYLAWRWYKKQLPPPPSGGELRVHVLDVGQGDSILIISPDGKSALIDAGANGKGQIALEAMARYGVKQLDYLIVSNAQVDHVGGCDEVLRGIKVLKVIDADIAPPVRVVDEDAPQQTNTRSRPQQLPQELPTVVSYRDFRNAVKETGAAYEKAEPNKVYDLGAGARLTLLAPTQPLFTKEQMRSGGGHELNANSVVVRLDYGDFSMLLPGEAEAQTEQRLISKNANLQAKILKVAHHGSKYATSEEFIKSAGPEVAIISTNFNNRYGHPSQVVLDRLRAAKVNIYRADLQGEITIATTGKAKEGSKLYEVKASREAKSDVWKGREAQKDDSSRAGFVAYGDYEPPKSRRQKAGGRGQ